MTNITPITIAVTDANSATQQMPVPPPNLAPVQVNVNAGFPFQIAAAAPGLLTRLYRVLLVVDGATTVTFCDGATVLMTVKVEQPGETIELDPQIFPWAQGSVNTAFNLNSSNNVQITGTVWINQNAT